MAIPQFLCIICILFAIVCGFLLFFKSKKLRQCELELAILKGGQQDAIFLRQKSEDLQIKLQQKEIELEKKITELQGVKENQKQKEDLQKEMEMVFQNISNKTITEQTEIGKKKIDELLKPFGFQIEQCKKAIDEVNGETKTKITTTIETMLKHTDAVGRSADNLADAFRGNKKAQGNWGENQLLNILEDCGLINGTDFEYQYSYEYNGKRYIPDFVIKLPSDKRFIIDAKMSLQNYYEYINAENEEVKEQAMKNYIKAIKEHIKELKKYQDTFALHLKDKKNGEETLDFVFMFFPLENAYIDAIRFSRKMLNGDDFLKDAFNNKVAIVTASSVFPILRMVNHLWSVEKSNKNINDITEKVVLLYEKLSRFCEEENKTHKLLENATEAHERAIRYLAEGNDNVLRTAKRIKDLMGGKITQNLDLFIENDDNDK